MAQTSASTRRSPADGGRADGRRRPRASHGMLRAGAWFAAGASATVPFIALSGAPFPATGSAQTPHRQVIIIQRTIRRVVYPPPQAAPGAVGSSGAVSSSSAPQVHYVYVGGGTVSGGSATTTRCSGC